MAAPPCGGWLAPPANAGRGVLVYDAFSKRIRHGLGNVFAGFVTMRALAFLSNRSLVVCDAGVLAPFLEPAGGWTYGDAAACAAPARGLPCDRGFFAASAAAAARSAGRVRCDCHRSFLHELAADPSIDVASLLGPAPCGAGAEAAFRHARSAAYRCRLRRRKRATRLREGVARPRARRRRLTAAPPRQLPGDGGARRGALRRGPVARRLRRGRARPREAPACLAAWNSNLQPEFNVRICDSFDASSSAVLRELDESNRFVQKSAESTSI